MINKVYFRVDGGKELGLGHLVRCIALAQMIANDFEIFFVSKQTPIDIIKVICNHGFKFIKIEQEKEFLLLLTNEDFVVLDHYSFNKSEQIEIFNHCFKLICINDIADNEIFADLVINHAVGMSPYLYNTEPFTQFALGSDYALLRPDFLNTAKSKHYSRINNECILICFGGADFKNLTLKVLDLVLNHFTFKKIIVVIGSQYQQKNSLIELIDKRKNVYLHVNVNEAEMICLIQEAGISIVPSSGILVEIIAAGNKIVAGMYIDNQKNIYNNYKKLGAFYDAGYFDESDVITAIKDAVVSEYNPPKIIDGFSAERISKIFKQFNREKDMELRRATRNDLDVTFTWATNKRVRAFSFTQSEISREDHNKWFTSKIRSSYYYIAEYDHLPIGSIRFDVINNSALISYLIDPEYHSMNFGVIVLRMGIKQLLQDNPSGIHSIIGYVLPQNIASCKIFEKFAFHKTLEGTSYKYVLNIN